MSWHVEFAGRNRAAVKAQIAPNLKSNPHFPQAVADAINATVDVMNEDPRAVFIVRSTGHVAGADAVAQYGPMDVSETTVRYMYLFEAPPEDPGPLTQGEPE